MTHIPTKLCDPCDDTEAVNRASRHNYEAGGGGGGSILSESVKGSTYYQGNHTAFDVSSDVLRRELLPLHC